MSQLGISEQECAAVRKARLVLALPARERDDEQPIAAALGQLQLLAIAPASTVGCSASTLLQGTPTAKRAVGVPTALGEGLLDAPCGYQNGAAQCRVKLQ